MTMVLIAIGVVIAAAFVVVPRRLTPKTSSLGTMSPTWLAEEQAGAQRY